MRWERVSDWCKRWGPYTICKVVVMDEVRDEIWRGREFLRAYGDAGQATAWVESQ